jgi:DNA-binding PadR family transcriptional regulator
MSATHPTTQSISRLELLILQFLNWKEPLYAYEIEKIIEQIHARDWLDIGFSTIYYALNRLYKKGFVSRKKVLQDSTPPRVLYTKTFSGETTLKTEVAKALHSVELPKSDYNQALLSIHLFEKDEILASSRKRLATCQHTLQEMRHAYEEQHGDMGQYIVLRNMRLLDAEISWLTDWIDIVETCDPSQWETMLRAGEKAHFSQHHQIQNTNL